MKLQHWLFVPSIALFAASAFAQVVQQPSSVNSGVGANAGFQGVVLSGQVTRATQNAVVINVTNSCFGTNLRHVSNPLSPLSSVRMNFTLNDKGTLKNYSVLYPASLVMKAGSDSIVKLGASQVSPANLNAQYAGNNLRITVPIPFEVTVTESGEMSDNWNVQLVSVNFEQVFEPGAGATGQYMGRNGVLSASVSKSASKDGRQFNIGAHFPGEAGFCGGYFSPLMVFFGEERPKFTAKVEFPLNPTGKTMWPEAGAPGAFIAFDRDGDGKIQTAEELFGAIDEKYKNGFEALREFDSNNDGIIDKRDKNFKKLKLWFDRNADGKTNKKELVNLSTKIKSISLKYDATTTNGIQDRAEVRERSTFEFVDKGQLKKGTVLDMWFAPSVE